MLFKACSRNTTSIKTVLKLYNYENFNLVTPNILTPSQTGALVLFGS